MENPAGQSNPHPQGSLIKVPTYSILIQHPEIGNIVFDTGPNREDFTNRLSKDFRDRMFLIPADDGDPSIVGCLAKCDLTVDDIDLLILSHCHWDHMGGISAFAGTKAGQGILVTRGDYANSLAEAHKNYCDSIGGYVLANFHVPGLKYELIEQEKQLAPGLRLLICSGHSPGVICLLAETEAGNFLFLSDAVAHPFNYNEPSFLPVSVYDALNYRKTIERIHDLERQYKATLLFGHDDIGFKSLKTAPYFYGE
jgi:glyoxylase-like metal-dependent hydrolase (beta-lactamase superfamily II)